jgi:hypothetical protein
MAQERPFIHGDIFLPDSFRLRVASEEYKKNLINKSLTINQTEKYWQANLGIRGRKANLDIILPPFEGTQKELSEAISNGFEPIPVPSVLAGPKGIDNLRDMYREEFRIPNLPRITDNTKDIWCYGTITNYVSRKQLKKQFPHSKIEDMTFARYIILAAQTKLLTGHLPDEFKLDNNIHTTSRISGSMIEANLLINENKKPDVPGVSFNQKNTLNLTRLSKPPNHREKFPNIITRFQIPITPRQVA